MKILGICGSLRKASFSRGVLRACNGMMPDGMSLEVAEIGDLPMYNEDIFAQGLPAPVKRLRAAIAAADGLLIATPEYNFSVTPVLKNAIDWASRPPDQPFKDKPIALVTAAQGPLGGGRVQYDLRRILVGLWGHVLPRPEVFIGNAPTKFDAEGNLTDETTKKFLAELLAGFEIWVKRVRLQA